MSFTAHKKHHRKVSLSFKNDKGLTEQNHKESCDIHSIMRKAQRTGVIEHNNQHAGSYSEYPQGIDFHLAMNTIAEANSMFESIPSHIRKEFDNDPSKFLDFIQNENNREAIEEFGFSTDHLPHIPPETVQPEAKPTSEPSVSAEQPA